MKIYELKTNYLYRISYSGGQPQDGWVSICELSEIYMGKLDFKEITLTYQNKKQIKPGKYNVDADSFLKNDSIEITEIGPKANYPEYYL